MVYVGVLIGGKLEEELTAHCALGLRRSEIVRQALLEYFEMRRRKHETQ